MANNQKLGDVLKYRIHSVPDSHYTRNTALPPAFYGFLSACLRLLSYSASELVRNCADTAPVSLRNFTAILLLFFRFFFAQASLVVRSVFGYSSVWLRLFFGLASVKLYPSGYISSPASWRRSDGFRKMVNINQTMTIELENQS